MYGLEPFDHSNAIILELVEGQTLQEVIGDLRRSRDGAASPAMPIDEVLPIARQVAEALEAAHDRGIVHRDLKPANVKLTPDGVVKVLDFGLAKLSGPSDAPHSDPAGATHSPTLSAMATRAGVIIGTAAYMSPEQARGRTVDKRTDVWAFGCMLFEMLTGKRAFDPSTGTGSPRASSKGEVDEVSDTLAAILRGEPDWDALPSNVPPALRTLLHRCLEKDRRRRIGDVAAVLFVLNEPAMLAALPGAASAQSSAGTPTSMRRERLLWAGALLVSLAASAVALLYLLPRPPDQKVLRLSIPLPGSPGHLALSSDGRRLATTSFDGGEKGSGLSVRSLDAPQVQLLSGTAGARAPFWSPDARSIGFFADGKLKIIPATGGPSQALCDGTGLGSGGTWNHDGVILFGSQPGPVRRVSAAGGACTEVTKPEGTAGHAFPVFLPDGQHFVYVVGGGEEAKRGLYLSALGDATSRRLLADQSSAIFAPPSSSAGPGHLVFLRESTLMAQPFDARTLQLAGDVFPVAPDASRSSSLLQVAAGVSDDGLLVYLTNPSAITQLRWMDRSGKELSTAGPPGELVGASLSPNEQTVAFWRRNQGIFLRDLTRDVETRLLENLTRITVWSPDGRHLAFGRPGGKLFVRDLGSGQEEELSVSQSTPNAEAPSDWSGDGRTLLYTNVDPKTQADIWYLVDPLSKAADRKPVQVLATNAIESQAQLSPDGRWLAYTSNESGQLAVYISPFPTGAASRISPSTAREPRWRRDGKELYYLEFLSGGRNRLMSVSIQAAASAQLRIGSPVPLFEFRTGTIVPQSNVFAYSPAADGQRFLVKVSVSDADPIVNVISNWEKAPR